MQKEMNVDTLPVAIAYETTKSHGGSDFRRRSASMQSRDTVDTVESEVDAEILQDDQAVSESPVLLLRKKIAPN